MLRDLAGDPRRRRRFAVPQFLVSNFTGPGWWTSSPRSCRWLPCRSSSRCGAGERSGAIDRAPTPAGERRRRRGRRHGRPRRRRTRRRRARPCGRGLDCRGSSSRVIVFIWGLPQMKALLDALSALQVPDRRPRQGVQRVPPVVAKPAPEAAVYALNWLSATGTGILVAGHRRRPGHGLRRSASWCESTGSTLVRRCAIRC